MLISKTEYKEGGAIMHLPLDRVKEFSKCAGYRLLLSPILSVTCRNHFRPATISDRFLKLSGHKDPFF